MDQSLAPIGIEYIGHYVPDKLLTNDDLAKQVDTSDEWIRLHTGIQQRYIASEEQASSDLGTAAAKKALEKLGIVGSEVDLLIVSSSAPDHYGFPSTACIIQSNLGCGVIAAFDITVACSGFVYAMQIAKAMMQSDANYRRAMVIAAEKLSSVTNWSDRSTAVLLGDGAGVAILSKGLQKGRIIDSVLYANGDGAASLLVPHGGSRHPIPRSPYQDSEVIRNKLEMDGRAVYNFAVKANQEVIEKLLDRNDLHMDDIAYIVPHQANERIIKAVASRQKVSLDRFYLNIARFANTSSASIPIALSEMQEKGMLHSGDLLLLVGFGSGLTYGGNLIRW